MLRGLAALTLGAAMMFEAWGFILPHQDPTDILILVNKQNRAPAVPIMLVKPDVPPTREAIADNTYMQPEAAADLRSERFFRTLTMQTAIIRSEYWESA